MKMDDHPVEDMTPEECKEVQHLVETYGETAPMDVKDLTTQLYHQITALVPEKDVNAAIDEAVGRLIVARCQTEAVRTNEDAEQVVKDYVAEMYDATCQTLAKLRTEHGGESFLAYWAPALVNLTYPAKSYVLGEVNEGFREAGSDGVIAALRRMNMHHVAKTITRRMVGL